MIDKGSDLNRKWLKLCGADIEKKTTCPQGEFWGKFGGIWNGEGNSNGGENVIRGIWERESLKSDFVHFDQEMKFVEL